ncbi:protein of unknown function [Candidatus Methylomirabilis oxygeniifera]|uniref:Uncharacterized protein n=1 Tax=Methylomirabilis oxygeniifera TaxID=671143 RepID=D5MEQ2_METO1|nr:protein of unknown function [Candidatus Methylomirabilis oxyfera]
MRYAISELCQHPVMKQSALAPAFRRCYDSQRPRFGSYYRDPMLPQKLSKTLAIDTLDRRPLGKFRNLFGKEAGCDEDALQCAFSAHRIAQSNNPDGGDRHFRRGQDATDDVAAAGDRLGVDRDDVDLPVSVAMAARDRQARLLQKADAEALKLLRRESFQLLLLGAPGLIVGLFSSHRRGGTIEEKDQAQTEQDGSRHQNEHAPRSSRTVDTQADGPWGVRL